MNINYKYISKIFVLFIIGLISHSVIFSQSIISEAKIDSLNNKSFEIRNVDPVTSILMAQKALKYAEEINYNKGILMSHSFIGVGYRNIADYSSALEEYIIAYNISDSLNIRDQKAYSLINIGNLYYRLGKDSLAIYNLKMATDIANDLNDNRIKAYCDLNLGRAYSSQRKYNQAFKHLNRALVLRSLLDEPLAEANTYIEVASLLNTVGLSDSALSYYSIALKKAKSNKNGENLVAEAYFGIGNVYNKTKQYRKSISFIDKSIKLSKKILDDYDLLASLKLQSDNYYKLKDYKKSLYYYKLYDATRNKSLSFSELNNFARQRVKFETERVKKDNELLTQKNKLNELKIDNQRVINIFIGLISVVLFVFLLIFFLRNRAIKKINSVLKKQRDVISEQKEELEELNKTKDKFFSIIAHDLRNPYMTLINSSEFLEKDYNDLNDNDRLELISSIKNSAKLSFELLDNLLIWARSQRGMIEFNPIGFNISELISRILPLLQGTAKNKQIKLSSELISDLIIYADIDMINTIIRNLVSNALKFTKSGGSILIKTTIDDNYCIISVKDTGIGMTEEVLNKIFGLKGKESSLGTTGETGSGLGLMICKEFVEYNKGSIDVSSEVGLGTTFSVKIPLKK